MLADSSGLMDPGSSATSIDWNHKTATRARATEVAAVGTRRAPQHRWSGGGRGAVRVNAAIQNNLFYYNGGAYVVRSAVQLRGYRRPPADLTHDHVVPTQGLSHACTLLRTAIRGTYYMKRRLPTGNTTPRFRGKRLLETEKLSIYGISQLPGCAHISVPLCNFSQETNDPTAT